MHLDFFFVTDGTQHAILQTRCRFLPRIHPCHLTVAICSAPVGPSYRNGSKGHARDSAQHSQANNSHWRNRCFRNRIWPAPSWPQPQPCRTRYSNQPLSTSRPWAGVRLQYATLEKAYGNPAIPTEATKWSRRGRRSCVCLKPNAEPSDTPSCGQGIGAVWLRQTCGSRANSNRQMIHAARI
jgi:hypothetical protein